MDHGGDNNDMATLMQAHRGPDHMAAIKGKSVHNQRIERLWLDLWKWSVLKFYELFRFMETEEDTGGIGVLDIDQHMWVLHYVFLPRINEDLQTFQKTWNNHSLRTEHNQSPQQIFVQESLKKCNTQLTAMQDLFGHRQIVPDQLTTDGLPEAAQEVSALVNVQAVPWPLSDARLQLLKVHIDPKRDDGALGVNVFEETLPFIKDDQ